MYRTNEVKFWLTIYSYFDVSMIMVIIIKKNKYLKKYFFRYLFFLTGLPALKLFKNKLSVKKKENVKITFLKRS